jgi:spermidine/putrescine transport system permease protein
MRRPISLYGLTFSLPLLVWQILFFVFPLVFLVALSFWTVKNFVMSPDFDTVNWTTMYGRKPCSGRPTEQRWRWRPRHRC